ncbi:MAG TPA: acyltransferase [Galbitalea sp.]|nr:acyltransferase [Galbitalea sp.]
MTSSKSSGAPPRTTKRPNNFDGIRLLAALAVLVGHGFILTDVHPVPALAGIPIDTLAVSVFFVVSGYLITGSWQNIRNARVFIRHRFLRIFPALWVVVLVTIFVIGPLCTTLSVAKYFQSSTTWTYLLNLVTLAQYSLPGVFEDSAHARSAVNGSLWTLGVELSCYIAVLILGVAMRRRMWVGFIGMALVGLAAYFLTVGNASLQGFEDAGPEVVFFALGALGRLVVPRPALRPTIAIAVLVVWLILVWIWPVAKLELEWIALPYCVLSLALTPIPVLRRAARFGDFSYGTYLWAFVLQQVELGVLGRIPIWSNIAIILVCTLCVAFASWHLIEKPSLARKDTALFARARVVDKPA